MFAYLGKPDFPSRGDTYVILLFLLNTGIHYSIPKRNEREIFRTRIVAKFNFNCL